MTGPTTVFLYGDSLMRATMPDETFRYHFHFAEYLARFGVPGAEIVNRAHFGATVGKGLSTLAADLKKGFQSRFALLEYGGNDCDFRWAEVAAAPEAEHLPNTSLPDFRAGLREMAEELRENGTEPVLMTLPPIDAERYFDFFCSAGLDRAGVLRWLGDVQMIYRFQELYSDTVRETAEALSLPLIDVRAAFLDRHDLRQLISADGIHLSEQGYALFFGTLAQRLAAAGEG